MRRRIADTRLAATLMEAGVTELITCNPSDFRGIDGLMIVDPRQTDPPETNET